MNQPIDTALLYQEDDHITELDITRFRDGKMSEHEKGAFLYHLDECNLCAQKFRDFLQTKNK